MSDLQSSAPVSASASDTPPSPEPATASADQQPEVEQPAQEQPPPAVTQANAGEAPYAAGAPELSGTTAAPPVHEATETAAEPEATESTEHLPATEAPATPEPTDPTETPPVPQPAETPPPPDATGASDDSASPQPPAPTATPALPRPIPRPGPRPGAPRPAAPAPPPAAAAPAATTTPPPDTAPDAAALEQATAFGRVDDEGNVWVRSSDGERQVGSYPGATAPEALAYFARKYLDLLAQVDLLEQRIKTTDLAGKDADAAIARLRESLVDAKAVGDLDALSGRLDGFDELARKRRAKADAARQRARDAAKATKERIVGEAETLAESTQWKTAGDRLRTLLEEWKAAPRLDRRSDDELWKRFSAARTAFDRARRHHFAALDSGRDEARARKEKLVKEAESLAGSTDWAATAARYRDLMSDWKAAGRAGREEEDALWERFRAAQDAFFGARSGVFSERDAEQRANLEQKEALAAEAEALLPLGDVRAARRALRSISERWDAIGHVPRGDRDRVEGRLRRVEDAVRAVEEGEWRRSNPEALARAEAAVAQLHATIAKLEAQVAKDRSAGKASAVAKGEEAIATRRLWLAEAQNTLADLSR